MAWVHNLIRCGLTIAAVVAFSGDPIADTLTKEEAAKLIREKMGFPKRGKPVIRAEKSGGIRQEPLFSLMQQIAAQNSCQCDPYLRCRDIFDWCYSINRTGKKEIFYDAIHAYDEDIKIESIKTIDRQAVISYTTYLIRNKYGNQLVEMARSSMASVESDLFRGSPCVRSTGSEKCDYLPYQYQNPVTVYAIKYDQGWGLN